MSTADHVQQDNPAASRSGGEADVASRTFLWCVPRVTSTALTKCLSFIEDIEVWFEPYLYAYGAAVEYGLATNSILPMEYDGNEEVYQKAADCLEGFVKCKMEPRRLSFVSVKKSLMNSSSKHVFVKDMAFSFSIAENAYQQYLPSGFKHTFLIRNPIRTLNSWRKAMIIQAKFAGLLEEKGISESSYDLEKHNQYFTSGCFVKEQYDLWKYVKENIESDPVVIDGDDLLMKPKETLSAYCAAVGLPYSDSLLRWDASADVMKKMKAPGDELLINMIPFFRKAMTSSQFLPPTELPSRDKLTPDVIRCSDRVMKYFEEMYMHRLKV